MALELLAGPFPVTDLTTGLTVNGNATLANTVWIDPDGLLLDLSSLGTYLIQMDGSAYPVGNGSSFREPCLTLLGGSAADPYSGDPWYSFHQHGISGNERDERIIDRVFHNSSFLIRSDHPDTNLAQSVTLHDRWLTLSGGNVRQTPGVGTAYATERAIPGFAAGYNFSWARERGHLWLGGTSGRIVLYDYVNKVEASPVWRIGLTTCAVLVYSKKHDVFVSMHTDGTKYLMSVWARTVAPASVESITFNVTPAAGRVVTARTRVLGSYGEVCQGETVAWSVVGEATMLDEASTTDDDGYASARVLIDLDAVGPDLTVTAEVAIP